MQSSESILAVGMAEAARRLGLSTRTIANLIKRGDLPSRKVGRRRLIAMRDLELFLGRDLSNPRTRGRAGNEAEK